MLWVYDLRTNMSFTFEQNLLRRHHLDEFVRLYNPGNRQATWSEEIPEGRWRSYDYDEILEDSANLPDPDVLALEIFFDCLRGDPGAQRQLRQER